MKDIPYPTITSFIETNALLANEPLPVLIASNLRVHAFKFHDFAHDDNILFVSLSDGAGCIGIGIDTIQHLELINGETWNINAFQNSTIH